MSGGLGSFWDQSQESQSVDQTAAPPKKTEEQNLRDQASSN